MSVDVEHLKQWVGRTEVRTGRLDPFPATALAATLDREDPEFTDGTPLPPLWHWLYFLPVHRVSEVGPDGHPRRGGFLPPLPLPRRMWAGGRFAFRHSLRIGDTVRKESRVLSVERKEGRTGPLVFVRVGHELADAEGLALTEEHDIVYRGLAAPASTPRPAPTGAVWERIIRPDPVLLFRYSALTFNGHRIHYDQPYATKVEGYPGLVVHGPLIATLLLDLLRRERRDATVATFAYRAVGPLFDTAAFAVCGAPTEDGHAVKLWARSMDGVLAMEASASLT
jgi:3-methylfumaryl-CoA hydratase